MISKNIKKGGLIVGILQGLLSTVMLLAGSSYFRLSYEELNQQITWTNDVPESIIHLIGILEILGAIGMTVPHLINRFKYLVPLASGGIALTMLVAILTHISLSEYFILIPALVLFLIACVITYAWRGLLK